MSQQGERHTGRPAQGDDWWGKLYDNEAAAEDTGPTPTPDTLDDRFTSAGAVAAPRAPGDSGTEPGPRAPRSQEPPRAEGDTPVPEPRHAVYPQTRHVWGAAGLPSGEPGTAAPLPEPTPGTSTPPLPPEPDPAAATPAADAGAEEPLREPPPPGDPRIDTGMAAVEAPRREAAPPLPKAPPPPPEAPRPEAAPPPPQATHAEPAPSPSDAPGTAAVPPLPEAPPAPPDAPYGEAGPPPPKAPRADAAPPPAGVPDPAAAPDAARAENAPPPAGALPAPPGTPSVIYVGDGPPTYEAEPTALPLADPEDLDELVADTVLDGARCGVSTLRAVSVRGDSARYRGEPRRDSLLTARFGNGPGALILVAMATGARATPGAHRAAAEVCEWIGRAVGLSHTRLAEDVRAGRRGDLKSGLHRLTDRSLGKLRAGATEQGLDPEEYAATLRCLLLPADPACRTRVFFGVGGGGLFRLRDGEWRDIEPSVAEQSGAPVVGFGSSPPAETPDGDRLTMDLSITTPPSPYEPAPPPPRDAFRFRASVARPGDTLLLCSPGLAEPLRGEPDLARHLANRWADADPPGLAAFLADTQVRVKGYADDRTAAAVWEA
ncbi:protein phosphatase 2C domain-containing protein [Streptomyces sp. BH097]|uniref:protein phosphatase 2C domain-containing protein n=1 Tax=unclassified Streptomyces TaxID=2593676 RepID=UPI003BB5BF56